MDGNDEVEEDLEEEAHISMFIVTTSGKNGKHKWNKGNNIEPFLGDSIIKSDTSIVVIYFTEN